MRDIVKRRREGKPKRGTNAGYSEKEGGKKLKTGGEHFSNVASATSRRSKFQCVY